MIYFHLSIKDFKFGNSELRTTNSDLFPTTLKRMVSEWKRLVGLLILLSLSGCAASLQNQEQAQVHMRVGDSLLQEGRPTQALAELLKAVDLDPHNAVIRNLLGIAYLEKGIFLPAIDHFKQALSLDPEYVEVHNNLGTALLRAGRIPEAIREFQQALQSPIYTTPHFAQFNLGQAYFALKDYEKAGQYYQEAVNNSPSYSLAYHGLGLALKALHKPLEASEALKKAVEYAPNFAQAHYDLGDVLLELHQISLARLAFKEVIRLVPESDLARKALIQLKENP